MRDARERRILAVTLRYPPYVGGGYELLTRDAVAGLRGRGHEVSVLAGRGRRFEERGVLPWLEPDLDLEGDPWSRALAASTAERFRLHVFRLANLRATARAIDATAPDVVLHFNLSLASLAPLLAARHAGVPTLGVIGDPWPANHWVAAWRADAAARAAKPGRLAALERAWATVRELVGLGPLLTASEHLRRELVLAGVPEEDVEVLHHFLPPDAERLARELGAPEGRRADGPLRVASVSSLWEGKGVHVLLEAAALAAREGVELELEVAGGGPPEYRARLERLAAAPELDGRVRFRGWLDRPALLQLVAGADALALPSLWAEPFGLAALEGMALGACVVASDRGGIPEIVIDGESGIVLPSGDSPALARALARLAADEALRARLAAAGRERAFTRFSHARFLDGLEAALERVGARAAGGAA